MEIIKFLQKRLSKRGESLSDYQFKDVDFHTIRVKVGGDVIKINHISMSSRALEKEVDKLIALREKHCTSEKDYKCKKICSEPCDKNEIISHNIKLQLFDIYGVGVSGTEFWTTVQLRYSEKQVTLQLPMINFQSGQFANSPYEPPLNNPYGVPTTFPPFNGGYLYTIDGYLPEKFRPSDIENRSWMVPSDNGPSLPYSFTQPNDTVPMGYILQVTNFGGIVFQGIGTFGNFIPPGPQVILPTTVSYLVNKTEKLHYNQQISAGPTITAFFVPQRAKNDALRDSHVNDAYDGVVAYAWSDNFTVPDKTNGTLNLAVSVGRLNRHGKLKMGAPVLLTNLAPNVMVWDTAIVINRTDKNNIVVSYGLLNHNTSLVYTCRAVSFDGGKTWPAPFDGVTPVPNNGPTNLQPTGFQAPGVPGGFGDNRGISSDKYGNIWYSSTNLFDDNFNGINQPYFAVSTDLGQTYSLVYTAPPPPDPTIGLYDFPQFCFGGDASGNYGVYLVADFFPGGFDGYPFMAFIPINGLGSFGTPTETQQPQFLNNNLTASITASADGRVWTFGSTNGFGPGTYPNPQSGLVSSRMVYKSPGPLDQNYAGPWDFSIANNLNSTILYPTDASQPVFGYFDTVQGNIYDDKRKALYTVTKSHFPDFSQNMKIYFCISRDNGQTWSKALEISNTDFANRGFISMALDSVNGNLLFGFYDGRNDTSFLAVEYYGAVITSDKLDCMINSIPLSNPIYNIPPPNTPTSLTSFSKVSRKNKFSYRFN